MISHVVFGQIDQTAEAFTYLSNATHSCIKNPTTKMCAPHGSAKTVMGFTEGAWEGEHPVSAKCWGLRNRFVRWWVLGCTPDNPISTLPFEKVGFF